MLRRISGEKYKDTALGGWLNSNTIKSDPTQIGALLEVLPLNGEQRQAVTQGLINPLTVITGPPGTGKSQVVTSLLVNAAWQGKTVLFASKNNKAVDVVEERTNSLGSRPVLLRLGANDHRAKLADYLTSLLSATTSPDDQRYYEELLKNHMEVQTLFSALENQTNMVIQLRNQLDRVEQEIEPIRDGLPSNTFQSLRYLDLENTRSAFKNLELTVNRASRWKQPFVIKLAWGIVKKERYLKLAESIKRFITSASQIGFSFTTKTPDDKTLSQYTTFCELVDKRLIMASKIQHYFETLERLLALKPLEDISQEYRKLIRSLTETSITLWQTWLRLQPARMTQDERRSLREYSSLMQLIVSSDDGQRIGSQVFQRFHELFPKIMGIFSSWAVTSLSARGRIPFEPGFFDLLIIDEASQCDIASALPLLYRAKRAIIIGDPKQLRHISALPPKQDRQLLSKHGLAERHGQWAYSVTSLWELSSGICRNEDIVNLCDHHRSHADIIEFSNHYFYEGGLRVATDWAFEDTK